MLLMKLKEPKMAKLTDTQLIVLSKAAARDDGLATIPEGLNKAAASKVGVSLVTRKLMREVQSPQGVSGNDCNLHCSVCSPGWAGTLTCRQLGNGTDNAG